ncbi:methylated-DNA--[protein]-cysteine S-methyltransferase [Pseudothermotoga sp.]
MESFTYGSIFGPICVRMKNGRVCGIELGKRCAGAELNREVFQQLEEYFRGIRKQLDFPVEVRGTEFQMRVWQALRNIPYGSTISYGEFAKKLGTSPRAVGQALKRNPLPLYFPCHRVVARDCLGGFSSGLEWKKNLLALERGERCVGKS